MEQEKAYELYRNLIKIRMAEEQIVAEYSKQEIRTPVHLCIGQEAIAVGVSSCLDKEDFVVSNHRCHGHSLAKGLELQPFFLELYGKQGGVTNGWGGSMHLCDMEHGVIGTSAIVAGGIPIGAGVALAQKIKKEKGITVIYFGDGAVDEGVFWETVNFAGLKKLPILFVFENNKYASQTPDNMRHSYRDIRPIVEGFGLSVAEVDGTDTIAVAENSQALVEKIRSGQGPGFLICDTYRWLGHVGIVDDSHTGYRSPEEVEYWRKKCPVKRMQQYLQQQDSQHSDHKMREIEDECKEKVLMAIQQAKEAPYALD